VECAVILGATAAGCDNRNWRRRGLSICLFMASAAVGAVLVQFGIGWPLLFASFVFSLAMVPLLFGDHQSK
jgi:uncharacterized membrane protein YoaK (UPF0700 family)